MAGPALRLPRLCNCYLDICGVVVFVVETISVIDSRVRVGVMSIRHHFTYIDILSALTPRVDGVSSFGVLCVDVRYWDCSLLDLRVLRRKESIPFSGARSVQWNL
jgi:hypothetical protein